MILNILAAITVVVILRAIVKFGESLPDPDEDDGGTAKDTNDGDDDDIDPSAWIGNSLWEDSGNK